mgnify:CR=1 FL=1
MSKSIKCICLFCKTETKDAVYTIQIDEVEGGYDVLYANARRGKTLKPKLKNQAGAVTLEVAEKLYAEILKTRIRNGYKESIDVGDTLVAGKENDKASGIIGQMSNAIDLEAAKKLIKDDKWVAQQKHDGERRLVNVDKDQNIQGINKLGNFTGMKQSIVDGIDADCQILLDTEDLNDHLKAFDILELDGENLRDMKFTDRHEILVNAVSSSSSTKVSPLAKTTAEKQAMFDSIKADGREGMVFKLADSTYEEGRPSSGGNHLKFKFWNESSVIVLCVNEGKRSVRMAVVLEDGSRIPVGSVTVPSNKTIPLPETVLEVTYLYAYKGGSLFQPSYHKARNDIALEECTASQLRYKPVDEAA